MATDSQSEIAASVAALQDLGPGYVGALSDSRPDGVWLLGCELPGPQDSVARARVRTVAGRQDAVGAIATSAWDIS